MRIVLSILLFIAGIAKAIMDTIQFHFSRCVFKGLSDTFCDPSISWENKYSSSLPDAFTDLWHLSQSIFLFCLFAAILFYRPILIKTKTKIVSNVVIDFILMRAVFGAAFVLFYNYILLK